MKLFNRLLLFYQKNYLPILSIIVVFIFVWHRILRQVLLGEGYMYFGPAFNFFDNISLTSLGSTDNFARIIFDIFPPLFKDNIHAYLILELVIAIIFALAFYTILTFITSSKLVSFTATIFFSTSYLALFEYLANGNYQRFVQRFPNLIPICISFYYLWKFYNDHKIKLLIASLSLFTISVLMGHFSTLFLPPFIFYSILQVFEKRITLKKVLIRVLICLSFIIISLYLTRYSDQKPTYNFISFFSQEGNISERVVLQIPIITIPIDLMNYFEKLLPHPTPFPNMTLKLFLIPCLIIYLGGGALVIKRLPKLRTLYLTALVSMLAIIFLYMYVDIRLNIQKAPFGEDRYYLPPLFFAVIMWALILKAIFIKNKVIYFTASAIILTVFLVYNTNVLWKHIDSIQYKSEMLRRFVFYIKNDSAVCNNKSIIVAPSYLAWPGAMISQYTCPGVTFFLPSNEGWEKELWVNKNHVFVFDYNYELEKGKDFDPNKGKVIDLTQKYRNGEKIIFN